jgi:hypothetical protein
MLKFLKKYKSRCIYFAFLRQNSARLARVRVVRSRRRARFSLNCWYLQRDEKVFVNRQSSARLARVRVVRSRRRARVRIRSIALFGCEQKSFHK